MRGEAGRTDETGERGGEAGLTERIGEGGLTERIGEGGLTERTGDTGRTEGTTVRLGDLAVMEAVILRGEIGRGSADDLADAGDKAGLRPGVFGMTGTPRRVSR